VGPSGRIRDIENLEFNILSGSRDFHPFQTIADGVNNTQSLNAVNLCLESHEILTDSSKLTAFANAIREHKNLEEVKLCEYSRKVEAARSALLDPVLRALSLSRLTRNQCSNCNPVFAVLLVSVVLVSGCISITGSESA
jgi:hypothetical protein